MKAYIFISVVAICLLSGCAAKQTNRYNQEASLSDTLSFDPLAWKVIASFVNHDHNTMSTLYGNDTAIRYARLGLPYPAGSIIALVTWSQREDPHWHGALIPGPLQSIERVRFTAPGPLYEKYEGKPLTKTEAASAENVNPRIAYLTGQKASVIP